MHTIRAMSCSLKPRAARACLHDVRGGRLEKNVLRQSVQTFVNDLVEFVNEKDSVQLILDAKRILRFYWTTSELSLLFKERNNLVRKPNEPYTTFEQRIRSLVLKPSVDTIEEDILRLKHFLSKYENTYLETCLQYINQVECERLTHDR